MALQSTPTLGSQTRSFARRALRVVGAGIGGAAIVTVLGLVLHQVVTGEVWRVERVEVVGSHRASVTAIRHLADVHEGRHLFTVDLDRAVRGAERHPWVKRASARRRFPAAVEIEVEEYEPVLLLAIGELWYVDDEGTLFRRATSDDLDYPVVTGLDRATAEADPKIVTALVRGALLMRTAADAHARIGADRLSEIHFDPETGFDLVLRNGTRLLVGFSEPTTRLSRLDRLLAVGLDIDRPTRVDLDADGVAIATPLAGPT